MTPFRALALLLLCGAVTIAFFGQNQRIGTRLFQKLTASFICVILGPGLLFFSVGPVHAEPSPAQLPDVAEALTGVVAAQQLFADALNAVTDAVRNAYTNPVPGHGARAPTIVPNVASAIDAIHLAETKADALSKAYFHLGMAYQHAGTMADANTAFQDAQELAILHHRLGLAFQQWNEGLKELQDYP